MQNKRKQYSSMRTLSNNFSWRVLDGHWVSPFQTLQSWRVQENVIMFLILEEDKEKFSGGLNCCCSSWSSVKASRITSQESKCQCSTCEIWRLYKRLAVWIIPSLNWKMTQETQSHSNTYRINFWFYQWLV